MGILRSLVDIHNPPVFWSAVAASVSLAVAVASFVKWLLIRRATPTPPRRPQGLVSRYEPPSPTFPPALLAFVAFLVFAGTVAGALARWNETYQMAMTAI